MLAMLLMHEKTKKEVKYFENEQKKHEERHGV